MKKQMRYFLGTVYRSPMLVENDYESWKIRIHRYIRGKPNGKLIWKSIQNGPTPHPWSKISPPTGFYYCARTEEKSLILSSMTEEENSSKWQIPSSWKSSSVKAYWEQSTSIVDPLADVAHTTSAPALSSPSTPSPQPTAQSPNDALMATMTQIANLLSGFQKQFPPTTPISGLPSNSWTHAYGCMMVTLLLNQFRGRLQHAEAEASLDDVEATAPYDLPQARLLTNMRCTRKNFRLRCEIWIDAIQSPYPSVSFLTPKPEMFQTEVSADTSVNVSMIALLNDCNPTRRNMLKDTHQVKLDLENKVRQEQAIVIQRNAELVQENDLLKSTLSGKEKSIAFLQSEKEKILSEKKDLADSYLDEIVCLKNANKVARDMLQRFNMPTQTIPMLSKKPKSATADLHKDLLGTRNPGLGYMAKRAQPVLYDADTLLHPAHHPVRIWDSEDVLVHQVVSMKKMSEKPGHVRPANGFYDKLNAMMFVPQKELSQEQAYWLSANEIASNASNPATPVTPFVHNRPPPSQVLFHLQKVNAVFHQFEGIINERTTQKPLYVSEWCFDYAKQFVEQQLVPFYEHFKKHIQSANETIFREVKEYEQIFDDLDAEYERCVLDNKNLTIEKKNLLIKNDCLIAECLEKDICSIVLTSDIVVPPSSNCLCEDLRSACDREHTKVLELAAEVLKQQKMVIESEKRNSHLQKTHIDLQLKFQNYKQCIDTSSASNAIFEINKLRKQLQGKDDTIRNLDAQISIMKVLNVGSTEGSCDQQALETDRIQLKDTITSLRIQLDGLKVENVSLKRRYDELSKANTHSRTAYTEKLSALTTQHTKLQAQVTGKTSSGPSTSETPKVLAPGMYNLGSKYIPPPKRANWVKPTPLPKKKQTKRLKRQPKKEWKPIKNVGKPIKRVWKPISKLVANSKPQWKPTGRHFSLFEKQVPKGSLVVQIVLWYLDSGCSRHMTGDRARLINFVEKFIGTVRFGNDEYAAIVGYGDYKLGDTIISRVYYVEGLKHNLFSVGQFCDGGLEVAFRQHSCHIRNYDMVDLLNGSRTTNLYSISLNDMMSASPVCLLTKASSTKSWLWHRRLNHLNFRTLNELARNDLVRGLPMLKYDKDHLCPSCQLGKSKKASHPLKTTNTNTEVLHTLHMDLCGPMRSESINKKKLNEPLMLLFASSEQIMERSLSIRHSTDGLRVLNAKFQPSTTVISEGAPAVTESLLPHQVPLPDTSDSDVETLFDHVDSNVFDSYNAPETGSEASSSNSVNIDVTPNNQLPHVQKWTQAHPLENIIGDKDLTRCGVSQ
ncbi:integrase, catalytic region, zinc finger, CCHC-type containing protein [Tanacetum coccineum]